MARIAIIIAPNNFRDEEYFEPKTVFETAGHITVTASTKTGAIQGSHGKVATSVSVLEDIIPSDFDAIVFVGGSGSYLYETNQKALSLIRDFINHNVLVAAICHAPIILAKAGVLKNKNATVFSDDAAELSSFGANYINSPVVEDGAIITANGPQSATLFANAILKRFV